MRAVLSFTLPEDQYEFDCARTGSRWQSEMRAFDEWLRSIVKHGPSEGTPPGLSMGQYQDAADRIRGMLWTYVQEAGGFAEDV